MNSFLVNMLQSAVCIGIFYLAYVLLLRNLRWFALNRLIIVLFLMLSLVLPFVSLVVKPMNINALPLIYESAMAVHPVELTGGNQVMDSKISPFRILSIIYISGVTFFLFRFVYSMLQLAVLYAGSPRLRVNDFVVVMRKGAQTPFTFFHILFVNEAQYLQGRFEEILLHESAHRKQFHSLDLLFVELIGALQWFNPFVWLFKSELKAQHEFFADKSVIEKGVCKFTYQKLLFEESVGVPLQLASNFNYSLLKQRLKMMTIKKNTRYPLLRYALIIPLVIFISLVMMAGNPAPIQTGSEVDAGPHYKEGQQALMIYLQSNIRYPQSAREQQLQSTVYVSFDVSASGEVENVSVTEATDETMEKLIVVAYAAGEKKHGDPEKALADLQKESIRVVNGLGNFEPAMRNNTLVKSSLVLSVKFVIQ